MNSMIKSLRFVAAIALGAGLLQACDSIKDVRDSSYVAIPATKGVIGGTIVGLGSARSVALQYDGAPDCFAPDASDSSIINPVDCQFFGNQDQPQSEFLFGAKDSGTPFFVTVVKQPFSKVCTVNNGADGSGNVATPANPRHVGDGGPDPVVTCGADPAVPRFDVTVNTGPLSVLPSPKVTLVTEDGTTVKDAAGQASVTFPDTIFNSGTQFLPNFKYQLYATYNDTVGGVTRTSYCSFTVGTGQNTLNAGGTNLNTANVVVVPVGDVTANVATCTFTASVTVEYSGTPAVATLPAGGMKLALVNHFSGVEEQTLDLPVGTAFSSVTTIPFGTTLKGNANSVYELVVKQQPAGMRCVVAGVVSALSNIITTTGPGGVVNPTTVTGATGSAVLALNPAVQEWWTATPRSVICRNIPTDPTRLLTGTYQRDRALQTASQLAANPPTVPARAREFLTFFDDGTFLWGINHTSSAVTTCEPSATVVNGTGTANNFPNCTSTTTVRNPGESGPGSAPPVGNYNAASGVEHGFYAYDPVAKTIVFTVTNASNIFPTYQGLNGVPVTPPAFSQTTLRGTATATNVTRTAATSTEGAKISLTFKGTRPGPRPTTPNTAYLGSNQTATWLMTEPESIAGEVTGAWATADHLRVFVYSQSTYFGFHMGMNGLPTLQDACFTIGDTSTPVQGELIRRSQAGLFVATCQPGGSLVYRDVPHYQTTGTVMTMPRTPDNYHGRFPGSAAQLDGRPSSPTNFTVAAGTGGAPDQLTVQATSNGIPLADQPPITFVRQQAN